MTDQVTISEGLVITLLKESFAQALFELTDRNRIYLKQWLPWLDSVTKAEDTLDFINQAITQNQNNLGPTYAIIYQGEIIGVIGYHPLNTANNYGEIGYWLSEHMQGNGFITKAARKLIEIGFEKLNLNRIQIPAAEENSKSRSIPERLGLKFEGIIRERELLYGKYVNHASRRRSFCVELESRTHITDQQTRTPVMLAPVNSDVICDRDHG